jgi:hypothetical protein
MGKEIKTPGNIKFGNMPAEYRMKYKKMIEKHNKEQEEKKKNKSKLQQFAERLYGGNK